MQSRFLIRNLIYFVSITSNLALGIFVFLKGKKEEINRIFFACILAASGWLISLFLFYVVDLPELVLWIGRFNFAIIFPLLYFLVKFAFIFPRRIVFVPKRISTILACWIFVVTALTLFTSFVDKEEIIIAPGQRETVYGPFYFLYILHYIIFSVITVGLLIYKRKRLRRRIEKIQVEYILIGLVLALFFGFTTNIFLYSLGLSGIANYGPLATVIFSTCVTAAIFKHYLFNIKVIATELFTVLLVFVLLISVFVAQTPTQKILNSAIFLGSLFFGISLIKSVVREIRLREESQRLAQKSQRLAQDLQKAYNELKKLDEAKSEFIAMASHQLRTPLTIIKGLVSMLIEGTYGDPPERFKKPLKNIFSSNERLVRIVNDLLSISKIELGKLEILKEKAQIENLIKTVVQELKPQAEKKKLYLKWEKPKGPIPEIEIDPLKIRQVIFTVIDNAIKYTRKGGITIRVKFQKLNPKINKKSLLIEISDTGEGMTREEAKKIFESFTRGAAGIKLWTQGTGLGLYLAKKYIELHHGKIWAESPGKGLGSTFYISLPLN